MSVRHPREDSFRSAKGVEKYRVSGGEAKIEPNTIDTDGWGAYKRHIDSEKHEIGKQHTQTIESKHINLRTRIKRLVRRTICFSKTVHMHDLVIGLFINRYEFGVAV